LLKYDLLAKWSWPNGKYYDVTFDVNFEQWARQCFEFIFWLEKFSANFQLEKFSSQFSTQKVFEPIFDSKIFSNQFSTRKFFEPIFDSKHFFESTFAGKILVNLRKCQLSGRSVLASVSEIYVEIKNAIYFWIYLKYAESAMFNNYASSTTIGILFLCNPVCYFCHLKKFK